MIAMQELEVSIPHQLGRAEAKQRIQQQMDNLRRQAGSPVANLQDTWQGDTMDVSMSVMGQSLSGRVAVEDQAVHLTLALPWLLRLLAGTIKHKIEQQGNLLLTDKKA